MPTAQRLREVFDYNPETGFFYWRERTGTRVTIGKVAGFVHRQRRHRYIHFDGKNHLAHRLAWLYVYGEWPENEIDHINRNPDDNRIANLRKATRAQNGSNVGRLRNNTSGYKGVTWHKGAKKWMAQIQVEEKFVYLGLFDDPAIAHSAYAAASKKYHGEFGRLN